MKANQSISNLTSDLQTTRVGAETCRPDYDISVTRFQRNNSNLQSALDAEKGALVNANQSISNLRLDLQTAREDAEALKANYDTKVTRLQLENSGLQSALGVLETKVTEDKRKLSLGFVDFKQWMYENSVNADALISVPDPSTSSSDIHHVLAHNALVKVRSEDWSSVYEDAQKVISHCFIGILVCTHPPLKSIVARPSAMAHSVKALAQIVTGDTEEALKAFDLAFGNCDPKESNLLLLIKVCDPCA